MVRIDPSQFPVAEVRFCDPAPYDLIYRLSVLGRTFRIQEVVILTQHNGPDRSRSPSLEGEHFRLAGKYGWPQRGTRLQRMDQRKKVWSYGKGMRYMLSID
jgi:hypothetical protein